MLIDNIVLIEKDTIFFYISEMRISDYDEGEFV